MISIRQNILTSVVKLRPKHDLKTRSLQEQKVAPPFYQMWHDITMVIETRLRCTTCPCNLISDRHHKASISQHPQHLNKENKKLRKLPEIAGRGIFRHESKIMSQSLRFILYMKRTHCSTKNPHFREPQKTGRFFLC